MALNAVREKFRIYRTQNALQYNLVDLEREFCYCFSLAKYSTILKRIEFPSIPNEIYLYKVHARIQRGDSGSRPPLINHKIIGFLSNTCPDPLNNHKATKSAFNVGPSSARQRNVI